MIYAVGDSHAEIFTLVPLFKIKGIGTPTAFNLRKANSTSNGNQQLFDFVKTIDKDSDNVILSFGEIDCRCHIYYQFMKREEKVPMMKLIDDTVESYGEVLRQLTDLGVRFYVLGPPPAGRQSNEFKFPWYATPEIHAQIYREFNERLKYYCEKHGYKFLDIYSKTVDPDGHILPEYMMDSIHLNPKAQKFLVEMLDCITPEMKETIRLFSWDR